MIPGNFYTEKMIINFTAIEWTEKVLLFVYGKVLLHQSFILFKSPDFSPALIKS